MNERSAATVSNQHESQNLGLWN